MQFFVLQEYCIQCSELHVCVLTLGEEVTREALDGPQEELVTELRARVKELQQHQERLLREGETLQVSPV